MSTDPTTTGDAATIAAATDDALLTSVVTDDATTLTRVPLSALPGWRVLDVLWRGPAHPARWLVAVDGDRAVVLTGHPERWDALATDAEVTTAEQAVELAVVRTDATHDRSKGYQRLSHVDEIRWLPRPGDEQRQRIEQVRADLADRIGPASAVGEGPWTVTTWVRAGDAVERLEVEVHHDGSTSTATTLMADDLPVPQVH